MTRLWLIYVVSMLILYTIILDMVAYYSGGRWAWRCSSCGAYRNGSILVTFVKAAWHCLTGCDLARQQ